MRIRTYNASRGLGKNHHWGRSIRLEWGTSGLALLLHPHPAIWNTQHWNINHGGLRSISCHFGPIGLIYSKRRPCTVPA